MLNPSTTAMANRRFLILLLATIGLISLISLLFTRQQNVGQAFINTQIHPVVVDSTVLRGDTISGKIGNETLK